MDAEKKAELKTMIQSLYRVAELPVWDGDINEQVAEVFGLMLFATRRCSDAFKWIPKPPGGRASITWLVMQLGRGVFNSSRQTLALPCARTAILKWRSALEMASLGIATSRLPICV